MGGQKCGGEQEGGRSQCQVHHRTSTPVRVFAVMRAKLTVPLGVSSASNITLSPGGRNPAVLHKRKGVVLSVKTIENSAQDTNPCHKVHAEVPSQSSPKSRQQKPNPKGKKRVHVRRSVPSQL